MTDQTREQAIEKIEEYLRFNTEEGDCSCEEHQTWVKEKAKEIHAILKSLGYVQKAEDQSLPQYHRHYNSIDCFCDDCDAFRHRRQAQQDMLKAGWVKVKKE